MSEKEIEASSSQTNALGSILQAARASKKLSIDEVCQAIHLSVKQIQALESNDFSHLPEPAITRGFIRNYANYLDVDAEPLLRQYRSLVPQEERSIVVKANVNEVMSQHTHQPWLMYVLGSILVLLFLTAWFYYMDSVKAPQETAQEEITAVTETENLSQNLPEGIVPLADNPNVDLVTGQSVEEPLMPAPSEPQPADMVTNAPTAPPAQAIAPAAQPAQALIAKKLEMQFSADSWVRVKDKTGKVILEKTATAGSTESLDGEPPFDLVIGNATAAKVKFYGQEVDLVPATSKNIIRLKLE